MHELMWDEPYKERVVFHHELFTNETVNQMENKYSNDYVVFLSDVNTPIHPKQTHNTQDETKIMLDMQEQMQDVVTMSPVYSCLETPCTVHHQWP